MREEGGGGEGRGVINLSLRYGAEIVLRRRLETLLATGNVPVVCVVIEGGAFSIKVIHDYLTT